MSVCRYLKKERWLRCISYMKITKSCFWAFEKSMERPLSWRRDLASKNFHAHDIMIYYVTIFGKGKSHILYRGSCNTTDARENETLVSRWKIFNFNQVFRKTVQKNINPCNRYQNFFGRHSFARIMKNSFEQISSQIR